MKKYAKLKVFIEKGAGMAANRLPEGQNLQKNVSEVIQARNTTNASVMNFVCGSGFPFLLDDFEIISWNVPNGHAHPQKVLPKNSP